MIQMMLVSPYSTKVPKFESSVTNSSPLGKPDKYALLPMPMLYQMLCGSVAMVLSSGAEPPPK
jgi:hypothetical protein